jgi:hypothetical protein
MTESAVAGRQGGHYGVSRFVGLAARTAAERSRSASPVLSSVSLCSYGLNMNRNGVLALVFGRVDQIWKAFCPRPAAEDRFVLVEEYAPGYWEAQNTEEAIIKAFSAEVGTTPHEPADDVPSRAWIKDACGVREINNDERCRIWDKLIPGVALQSYPFVVVRFEVFADMRHVRLSFATGSLAARGAQYVVVEQSGEPRLELDPDGGMCMA